MSPNPFRPVMLLLIGLAALLTGGCFSMGGPRKTERSSSVVAYLYPNQTNPLPPTSIPVLRLPLRVGIAFVPTGNAKSGGYYAADKGVSEQQKSVLLERVAAEFKNRDYIQSIELVPSTYLRAGGGFDNLNQVRSLIGVDVIALVAYDQVQFTNNNILSLSYWTIVGAYIFHGNQNDTQTLMESAVYDIASRHLLFRAPGASRVEAGAAAVYVQQRLRADSAAGFDAATTELIANLKLQLESFRERVKKSPGEVKIEHKPGYTGGGSFDAISAAVLGLLLLARALIRRCSSSNPL
ncbi:MAG: rhombotarget lipoprotein [Undibacterium sp.]|nr:rhombotarget lipoprotein [Opitutaceae bacterium]